jgi:hypothetical protein
MEFFAGAGWPFGDDSARPGSHERAAHLDACPDCREEVEAIRAIVRCLNELPEVAPASSLAESVMEAIDLPAPWLDDHLADLGYAVPAAGFAESVMQQVDLPAPWLDEALAGLPRLAPSGDLAGAVMHRVDLPVPWLDRALARVPQPAPAPGFATSVMARVQLPIPWHQRIARFMRRRRVALAGAAASTVAVSAAGAAWLFGVQGVTPVQFVTFVLGGVRDLAVRSLVALGGVGYELGLVDAGMTITDINPVAAVGSLALASVVGLLALFVMARLMRTSSQLRLTQTT